MCIRDRYSGLGSKDQPANPQEIRVRDRTARSSCTAAGSRVSEPRTTAELEKALAQALVDLKAATEARRRLPARSPDLLQAVRVEREVMERIERLIVLLRDRD